MKKEGTIDSSSESIKWNAILGTLRNEKCLLCIGPEIFSNDLNKSLEGQLTTFLNIQEDHDIVIYPDGLFFFRKRGKRTDICYDIEEFYQQPFPKLESILQKIAQIPFHFIISLTPDLKIYEAFGKQNIDCKFDFYWKKQVTNSGNFKPTQKLPLIYNLLGNIRHEESLILTYDDLYDYFESVFQGRSFSLNMKESIQDAKYIICLGLPFEKWYMQLLLRILQLHVNQDIKKYASNLYLDGQVQKIYHEQFDILFIPKDIESFVDELYYQCSEAGMLRTSSTIVLSELDQIKALIVSDELESALERLENFIRKKINIDTEDYLNDVVGQRARLRRCNRRMNEGLLTENEYKIEYNQIRKGLIEFLSELNDNKTLSSQ